MTPSSTPNPKLLRRIRRLVAFFIVGLVLSGATAIPLETELDLLTQFTGAQQLVEQPGSTKPPVWAEWLCRVQTALHETNAKFPFMSYGGDWLAFGHFVIAIVFIGAWRDPVRNVWLVRVRPHRLRAGDSLRVHLRSRARNPNLVAAD